MHIAQTVKANVSPTLSDQYGGTNQYSAATSYVGLGCIIFNTDGSVNTVPT